MQEQLNRDVAQVIDPAKCTISDGPTQRTPSVQGLKTGERLEELIRSVILTGTGNDTTELFVAFADSHIRDADIHRQLIRYIGEYAPQFLHKDAQ